MGLVVHPQMGLGVHFLLGDLGENSLEEGCLANLECILLEIAEACYKFLNRVGILL